MFVARCVGIAWLAWASSAGAAGLDPALRQRASAHYVDIARASYSDSVAAAEQMRVAIDAFLQQPSSEGLSAARKSWTTAHRIYSYTEVFRFFNGPIDDARGLEKRINSWPIDAAFLDYTQADANAGIINHAQDDARDKRSLSASGLAEINQRDSERNVSIGFHAIEFLLWGEDLSTTGPGDRPYTDYVIGQTRNAERRAAVLKSVTALLVDDLKTVSKDWTGAFGARFATDAQTMRRALIGFSTLAGAELGGERLSTPLHVQSQEEEQSCFSDTTGEDIIANVGALKNVWTGRYARLDGSELSGVGLRDVIRVVDASTAKKMDAALTAVDTAAQALHAPFDQEIVAGNPAGRARVALLIEQLDQVAELGKRALRLLAANERKGTSDQ